MFVFHYSIRAKSEPDLSVRDPPQICSEGPKVKNVKILNEKLSFLQFGFKNVKILDEKLSFLAWCSWNGIISLGFSLFLASSPIWARPGVCPEPSGQVQIKSFSIRVAFQRPETGKHWSYKETQFFPTWNRPNCDTVRYYLSAARSLGWNLLNSMYFR